MIQIRLEDPIKLFSSWLAEASSQESINPNAAALATADAKGIPSVRMVLLKAVNHTGFTFYTNLESRKGKDLQENPFASLCFYWKSISRQVRIEGRVVQIPDNEADKYFSSRPRDAQLGAWASKQSSNLTDRAQLEKKVAEFSIQFAEGNIPRPKFWSGYRILPAAIEFWREMPFRLHERKLFLRNGEEWDLEELYP